MGSVAKFNYKGAYAHLRHILREVENPTNIDIDESRTHLNYSLTPRRAKPYAYLKKRLSELHHMDRADVNVMSGWVITKPRDLSKSREDDFFKACYDFMENRYGGKDNVISCEVHKDESGEPHMHFYFIPVVKYTPNENLVKVVEYFEKNPSETNITKISKELGISRKTIRRYKNKTKADIHYEKVCCNDVIDKMELLTFHKDLQKYLTKNGIDTNVNSGITKQIGGNKNVKELKMQRDYLINNGYDKIKDIDNSKMNEVVEKINKEIDI